ncbi:nuclear transport factor 2 family protein [Bradyrhizobium sp.]|uniref:nuclear transport factor 2 family protein n=1 Tax=Bradyrhizobium sp. TaxID=376 RepID=UPI002C2253E3|nr:nuclear transport factor 2 family protein [Bradyrhizobium sp.]HMM92807.1 nuclear transport factor 2 family protein [Bradyrhizobium sp.]
MPIPDDRHTASTASSPATPYDGMDGIANLAGDFDPVALVVDWLDACRNRDLATLLDLYADNATLRCQCGEAEVGEGRAGLESYWKSRLDTRAPTAFGLEEILPTSAGVVLDYLSHEGKPVRIAFSFTRDGKIQTTDCLPMVERSPRAGLQDYAG